MPPIDFLTGLQGNLPRLFGEDNTLKLDSMADYENALDALYQVPEQLSQVEILLREGVKRGVTHGRDALERARVQWEGVWKGVGSAEESDFYKQFAKIRSNLPDVSEGEVKDLQDRAKAVIDNEILPAFEKLTKYIYGEYYQHLRKGPGVNSLPNGDQFYQVPDLL